MYLKYKLLGALKFLTRIISALAPGQKNRRKFREFLTKKIPNDGNEFLLIKENGKIIKFPNIKGFKVNFHGKNNKVILHEPYKLLENNFVDMAHNNGEFILESSDMPICNLRIYRMMNNSKVHIGKNFSCRGVLVSMSGESGLALKIGNNCLFSSGIEVQPTDSHAVLDFESKKVLNRGKNITIGNHVWCSRNVTFLKGSHIPDNSVIATKCVVTKDYRGESEGGGGIVVGGVPAKILKRNITWSKDSPEYVERMSKKNEKNN